MNIIETPDKAGWRVTEWGAAVGISRAQVYVLIRRGAIDSVKLRYSRIITTSPADYLASLRSRAA